MNFEAVYENAVVQELSAAGIALRYFRSSRKGEIDFLVEDEDCRVTPIEVKSGKDYRLHTALNNLLETKEYGIEQAFVLSEANVSIGERKEKPVIYLPLYMAPLLAERATKLVPGEAGLSALSSLDAAPPQF